MGLCEQPSEEAYLRQEMGSCHAVVDAEVKPITKAVMRFERADLGIVVPQVAHRSTAAARSILRS